MQMVALKLSEEERSKDRRKFPRFGTELKAQFVSRESHRGGEECTIVDFSRKGMGAKIYTTQEIHAGSDIVLEVFIPGELDPILVKGTIKWIKQMEGGYFSGIELSRSLDEIKLSKLHLCSATKEIEKDEKIKIKIVSSGLRITPQLPKDRFIP